MAWRDDVREFARLDGKEFAVDEVTDAGGADGVIHKIATSGNPVYEGIGPGAKIFNVQAKFVGEDYLADMDELIEILEQPKTHQFVHPYRGNFKVALVGQYTLSNRRTESGMCRISFQLVALADQAFPLIRDADFEVRNQVALMNLALIDSYSRRFKLGSFAKGIIGTIGLATVAMRSIEGKIQAAMNIGDAFGGAVTGFTNQATSLLRKPQDMINSMTGTALGIIGAIATAPDNLPSLNARALSTFTQAMREIFDQPRPTPPRVLTAEGELEHANSVQWWLANRISFLGASAQTATELTFTSSDAVNLFKSEFLGFFDEITQDEDLDDQMYSEVRQLKAAMVTYLSTVAQDLPSLTTYTTYKSRPALVIAYDVYGNNDRNLELVDRNGVTHPMFVPPRELEIVGDA